MAFKMDAYNGPIGNIDAMMRTVSNNGYCTAILIFANIVAERMREHGDTTDEFAGEIASSELLRELEDMDVKDLQTIAWSLDLTTMPRKLLLLVLSILFHIDTQRPIPDDIHAFHEFRKASKATSKVVEEWIRDEPAKSTLEQAFKPWVNYPGFKEACKAKQEIAIYNASQNGSQHSHTETYAYRFVQACHCTACLKIVVDLGLVDFRHYGRNGKSLLHAVIEGGHYEVIVFAIGNLLNLGVDPRHSPTSINGMSIPQHVALLHDNNIFKGMVEKLEEAGYPISLWNDDGLKLELCSFATDTLADWLLERKFNIAKLPRNTLPIYLPDQKQITPHEEQRFGKNWNRDAEYADPILRHEGLDSENDDFDPMLIAYDSIGVNPVEIHPISRTIWHRAVENPQGPLILDWLLDHSHIQPSCKTDFDRDSGETTLVTAARGNEPAGIDWLCQNCDPMAPKSRTAVDATNRPAYAMQTAAHSTQPSSAAILYVISSYGSRELYQDLGLVRDLYWLVVKGYGDARRDMNEGMGAGPERMQHLLLIRNITRGKIKVLNTRLQAQSDWNRWRGSGEFRWLLGYCELLRFKFLIKDLKSGISFDLAGPDVKYEEEAGTDSYELRAR
jgi:hypothetical protein